MNYPSTVNEKVVTVSAGQRLELEVGICDYLFFQTFPNGLSACINDAAAVALPEGLLHKGPPGLGNFRRLALVNPTGSALTARLLYGLGEITVAGSVSLIGSFPMPVGASSAALQTALNAAVATAAKQDAQTALLTTLSAAVTETPDVVTLTNASAAYANRRTLSVTNTGSANITVNSGAGARTLAPGDSVDWAVSGPFNKLASVTVDATGSVAVVTSTV